jgi:disulfide bond formation protein DsbB
MLFNLRMLAILTAFVGSVMLGGAFAFQHLGGLDPCVLCIDQRWAWAVVIAASVMAIAFARHTISCQALLAVAAIAMLAGAGFAGFHVGVEQHWWEGTSECGGVTGKAQTVEELKRQLFATPVTRCDEVAWSMAGVSMAGWNLILSLVGGILLGWRILSLPRSLP